MVTPGAGLTYQGRPRTAGFRLSRLDVAVIVTTILITASTFQVSDAYSLFGAFVVAHFFLFCNVFRIRRTPELIWGGLFLINCCSWALIDDLKLAGVFATQLVVTVAILGFEIRQPTYHGILAHRINPKIEDYLAGRI